LFGTIDRNLLLGAPGGHDAICAFAPAIQVVETPVAPRISDDRNPLKRLRVYPGSVIVDGAGC